MEKENRKQVEGQLQHHGRFAFVISEPPETQDVMVRGPSLHWAFDGDRVVAQVISEKDGRRSGEIVRVVERAKKTLVGELQRDSKGWVVKEECNPTGPSIRVEKFDKGLNPSVGALAVVHITRWPDAQHPAAGAVHEILGHARKKAEVRVSAVLREREIPETFPTETLKQADSFPDRVSEEMWRGRMELFNVPVFTIDGSDAKDFDDAVSLQRLNPGWFRLGVHIADVSHYVRAGTPLDREASQRATSVYLPGKVVPMLPLKLSAGLCSLMPEVERLTVSCFLDLNTKGEVKSVRFADTVIRSWQRFTYEEIETILTGGKVHGLDARVRDSVRSMGELASELGFRRFQRGALDLDFPEYGIELDPCGEPIGVTRRERLKSHRLIEEFMLLANEAAARHLISRGHPFLSRVHGRPETEKLEALAVAAAKLGLKVPAHLSAQDGSGFRSLLELARHHPLKEVILQMALRSLKQAVYSSRAGGHFGLASQAYCHFTSPIRRYPDLVTHRALKRDLSGARPGMADSKASAELQRLATHCSERERVAADAERTATDALRIRYLATQKNRSYKGVVMRVEPFGAFVTLTEVGASGLIRASFGLVPGQQLKVYIDSAREAQGELDLRLTESKPHVVHAGRPAPHRHHPRRRR